MPKRYHRRIDNPPPVNFGVGGGGDDGPPTDDILPPAPEHLGAPTNLQLATGVGYSSAAPTAYIAATWDAPEDSGGRQPAHYQVQVSTGATFTAAGTITATATTASARIESLLPGTLYYVRVRAFSGGFYGDWTAAESITTATDTTAAGVPTSPTLTWVGYGDALITCVNPTEANFKIVQGRVRASAGGTIYRTFEMRTGRFLYTLAMNKADTGGAGDTSLYVEMWSRTFSNVDSAVVNTGLVTKSAPATPTGVAHTWSGDAGTAGADWEISWTDAADAATHRVTIDSIARGIGGGATSYTYAFAVNKSEHSGTPDPVLSYSVQAVDGFGQTSTAVSGTATNAAPAAPTATLTRGAISGVKAEITSTPPADLWRYEYVFKRDGSTVATVYSPGAEYTYEMQGAGDGGYHSWSVVVRQQDLFAQFSATHTPAAVAFEGLTLDYLREDIVYSDSPGNSASTLKAALADGVTVSGGQSYAA